MSWTVRAFPSVTLIVYKQHREEMQGRIRVVLVEGNVGQWWWKEKESWEIINH
jgi:hypothetical protein